MVARRPVVVISGQQTELPPGDSIVGGSVGALTAGSGLNGGGDLVSTTVTNVSLAPNPSGLILVDNKYLANDGVALRTGQTALASGNYALAAGTAALASGVAGSTLAATALASGTAAQTAINAIPGGTIQRFTAASAIASGYAVGLDDSKRVQSIREVANPNVRTFGSAVVFESATTYYTTTTFDSTNNRTVIVYQDAGNSNYGTAVVGTVSGTSISFGTPVVFQSSYFLTPSAVYDLTNNRVVIAYRNLTNSNYGTAIVGTVSGTSISFGSAVVFLSAGINSIAAVYDSTNSKVIVAYRNTGNLNYGTAIVGTVSGTSISFGTPTVFASSDISETAITHDTTSNKIIIAYKNTANSDYGTAIVGTVSGTSISFGTAVVFQSAFSYYIAASYDSSNNRTVISYSNNTNANVGTSIVGTVSGTSISFGTAVLFATSQSFYIASVFDSSVNRIVIAYRNLDNSGYGTAIIGAVSGTSISFNTPVVFESAEVNFTSAAYDSVSNRVIFSYSDAGNLEYGTAIVSSPGSAVGPTISSRNNFIGIAQTTAASGSAVNVRLPGSYDQNNTGLTPGAVYYVNPTTSGFTTTATQPSAWSGAVNWGPIGRAVNSTTLLLTDMI
jgi:hypothetical protein